MKLDKCLICGNKLTSILDLGNQPLANSYCKTQEEAKSLLQYPLAINLCEQCYHCQLTETVDPSKMFRDYLYVSGTSNSFRKYLEEFATKVESYHTKGKLLEIASNDGSLLEIFKSKGWDVTGVDPAVNLKKYCDEKDIKVIPEFWNEELASTIEEKYDVIVAMNVLPHVPDPVSFVRACKKVLAPGGIIVIQSSQCNMFENKEFDCIYHEHVSYFSAKSYKVLANQLHLFTSKCHKVNIHSKSYIIVLSQEEDNYNRSLEFLIEEEAKIKRYTLNLYKDFAKAAFDITENLSKELNRLKEDGYLICGYGASAKGNTLLNFVDLPLTYIVDDNDLKNDLWTPGAGIKISNKVAPIPKQAFVLLAWNFADEIISNVKKSRNLDDVFVSYFPEVNIIK